MDVAWIHRINEGSVMSAYRPFRLLPMTTALFAVVLASGCAVTPPAAERMVVAPTGTVLTYHRKSSGSLGAFDGKVVWNQSNSSWQGQPMVAVGSAVAGTTLHEPARFGIVAIVNPAGQPVVSYTPPIAYQWPLEVGKAWTSSHTATLHASGKTIPVQVNWKVEAWEDITVPAGTFKAYKLVWADNLGETETRWVNPQASLATIKRHVERPATHPQGAGVLDAELQSYVFPGK